MMIFISFIVGMLVGCTLAITTMAVASAASVRDDFEKKEGFDESEERSLS